jgi:hypothetical protein
MQEFSSVTASSYDPNALVALLNDSAAEGWDVVSIVGAGTNIVAYLTREASEGSAPDTAVEAGAVEAGAVATAAAAPTLPDDAPADATADEPTDDAVSEPAGWAAAPESLTETTINPVIAETAASEQPVTEPAAGAADVAAAAESAAAQQTAAESTVPAGWYADPSGRFELRYWDGAAWTEHVSRAGQQYTDPPVA